MYPLSVLVVAFVVVTVIMIFVIPAFKSVFAGFGADLPAPTLFVIAMSEFFVAYWWLIFGGIGGGLYFFMQAWQRNEKMQKVMDRLLLKVPVFGILIEKSCIARWTRTLSTMFAAGVPLVEALDSVGGASGNSLYADATEKIPMPIFFPRWFCRCAPLGRSQDQSITCWAKLLIFMKRRLMKWLRVCPV
jgi:type IV pilus assembly protein PilC